jgi:hypothetical protein
MRFGLVRINSANGVFLNSDRSQQNYLIHKGVVGTKEKMNVRLSLASRLMESKQANLRAL